MKARPSLDEIFGESPSPAVRPSLDDIFGNSSLNDGVIAAKPESSLNSDMTSRGAKFADIVNATKNGNQTIPEGIYQGVMNEVGAGGDVIGRGINSVAKAGFNALPQNYQQGLQNTAQSIAQSPMGQLAGRGIKAYGENLDAYNQENPRAGRNFEATREISNLIPFGNKAVSNVAGDIAEAGGSALKSGAESITNKIPFGKTLPQDMQSLDALVKAGGQTFLSKNPNALEQGLKANQEISHAYNAAQERTNQANIIAREIGNNTPVPAEDVYERLDRIIGSLQGKVAPGKETSALDQLTSIRDNLNTKNPKIVSTAGETVAPRTILPGDLMDIEKTINQGLPDKKFLTSGAGQSLSFKKTIQNALERAGEINPEFKDSYGNYKSEATNLMKTFVKNDSLKPFWQPEDYVAWKSHQNNPAQEPLANKTYTRANNILPNLNTSNLGEIKAVIDALPSEQGQELMRSAFIKAKQEKISMGNAVMQLLRLNPKGAAMAFGKSFGGNKGAADLTDAMRDLKAMKSRGNK